MSFMGLFPNQYERQRAKKEAALALERHGDEAASILLHKARKTRSSEHRVIYKLAAKAVEKMRPE